MKATTRIIGVFAATLLLALPAAVGQDGSSPFDPAPAGVQLSGIIECGRGYTSHELYDMKITLVEVLRGDAAWKGLLKADDGNEPADSGFEYILARVRFEYSARTAPGLCVHKISPEQFKVNDLDGAEYAAARVTLPDPPMSGDLKAGQSLEGWVAFAVPVTEQKPMLNYSADQGGAILHGGGKWFRLY